MMQPANFSFRDWEERTSADVYSVPALNERKDLPQPPDRYVPGHISWGKDPKRGRAIMRAREQKRLAANTAFFLSDVLPLIEADLNVAAWHDLAQALPDHGAAFYARGGWVRYTLGERASWIHPIEEPEKVAKAIALGASPQPPLASS